MNMFQAGLASWGIGRSNVVWITVLQWGIVVYNHIQWEKVGQENHMMFINVAQRAKWNLDSISEQAS